MDIQFNFTNRTDDKDVEVVVFQKNIAYDYYDQSVVAWKVIKYCGPNDNQPFPFSMDMEIAAADIWGNYTRRLSAYYGDKFSMTLDSSGNTLDRAGFGTSPKEVQLRNDLHMGSINAYIYKNSKLLAAQTSLAPRQKAAFEFKPTLWIGAANQLQEGDIINAAILSDLNTELSVLGIQSADIVMTGSKKNGYHFNLENIVMS